MANMSQANKSIDFGIFGDQRVVVTPTVLSDAKCEYESEIVTNDTAWQWIADSIAGAIETTSYHDIKTPRITVREKGEDEWTYIDMNTAQLFMACMYVALGARLAQVRGRNMRFDKKNFEYIALMGPVLAAYGVYDDPKEAYRLKPIASEELNKHLEHLGAKDEHGFFIVPQWYQDVMFFFRKYHVMTTIGLPKETMVDSNIMFKLSVDNGKVVGHPDMPTAAVLISALVYSSKITDLFGAYRTLYTGITTLRSTFETIGLKALHALETK